MASLTDRVAALASQVAATVKQRGVPAGGTAGQVLTKSAAGDYAVGWGTAGFPATFADAAAGNGNGTATVQTLGAAFTTLNLPVENSDAGGNFDPTTSLYTVPSAGLYLIIAKVRVLDSDGPGRGLGIGVHTTATDGPWFVWQAITSPAGGRVTLDYQRLAKFNAGDALRLYAYATSSQALSNLSLTIVRVA